MAEYLIQSKALDDIVDAINAKTDKSTAMHLSNGYELYNLVSATPYEID